MHHRAGNRFIDERRRFSAFSLRLIIFLFVPLAAWAERPPAAAIASAHPLATEAGFEILAAGGNAFDAVVAAGDPRGNGRAEAH